MPRWNSAPLFLHPGLDTQPLGSFSVRPMAPGHGPLPTSCSPVEPPLSLRAQEHKWWLPMRK